MHRIALNSSFELLYQFDYQLWQFQVNNFPFKIITRAIRMNEFQDIHSNPEREFFSISGITQVISTVFLWNFLFFTLLDEVADNPFDKSNISLVSISRMALFNYFVFFFVGLVPFFFQYSSFNLYRDLSDFKIIFCRFSEPWFTYIISSSLNLCYVLKSGFVVFSGFLYRYSLLTLVLLTCFVETFKVNLSDFNTNFGL